MCGTDRFEFLTPIQRSYFYGKRVGTDEVILQSLQMVQGPSKFTTFGNKKRATTYAHIKYLYYITIYNR
jgi:hypothetical protein